MDFNSVYEKIEKMVRWRVEKGVDEFEVEDVIQDVLLKIWRGWETFDGKHLSGWVDRVTQNHLIDLSRKQNPDYYSLNVGWETNEERDIPRVIGLCDENTPEMELSAEEMDLEPKEEQCLKYYANGLDYGEIATILGSTEGSVRMVVSRAKSKLNENVETNSGRG